MQVSRGRHGDASLQRADTFSGSVWSDPVLSAPGVMVASIMFPPRVRTYWHTHESGQLLFITHGRGFVQTRAGEGQWVAAGDVVHFPPGEEHWHGAGPDSYLVHTAVSLGATGWLDEVTDEHYDSVVG
jgi:quercetin dioxygenase-like cupin family protein